MSDSFLETAKGILTNPEETFLGLKETTFIETLKFLLFFSVIFSIIIAVETTIIIIVGTLPALARSIPLAGGVNFSVGYFIGILIGIFILCLIFIIIVTLITAVIIHLSSLIFGGRQGLLQTLKIVVYGNTPLYLIGWIPYVGLLGLLWSYILVVLGIRELQQMPTARAIYSILLSIIITVILLILLIVIIFVIIMMIAAATYMPSPIRPY